MTRWEISFLEFRDRKGKKFKVTRKLPDLPVTETKVFRSKRKAKEQFEEWLQ